jgi:hypothetical protein
MFLGLPDPDPLVRGMDPDPERILLSSCKNSKKNLDSYYFVILFDFLSFKNDVNVPSDPDPGSGSGPFYPLPVPPLTYILRLSMNC